jgi:SHAQKYF class myb-like DNA-binding protein
MCACSYPSLFPSSFSLSLSLCVYCASPQAFIHGLNRCGRKWARIAEIVKTRTPDQVRSHAQKYFIKLAEGGELDHA